MAGKNQFYKKNKNIFFFDYLLDLQPEIFFFSNEDTSAQNNEVCRDNNYKCFLNWKKREVKPMKK